VFIAAFNIRDGSHSRGREMLERALDGDYGEIYTSDFVLDEIVSGLIKFIEKGRLKRKEVVGLIEDTIQNSAIVSLKHVDRATLGTAKTCFKRYHDKFLSLTDWSTAVLMRNLYKIRDVVRPPFQHD
jgi:predicted nucleic acid-binding protein